MCPELPIDMCLELVEGRAAMSSAMDSAFRATLLTNAEAGEVIAKGSWGRMSVTREQYERSAGCSGYFNELFCQLLASR